MSLFSRALVVAAISSVLHGCTSLGVGVGATMSQFHELDPRPRSFIVVPLPDQEQSLEFKAYAAVLSERLKEKGWKPADLKTAEVAVTLKYGIGTGRQSEYSYPILGAVPTGSTTTTGTVNTFGNNATFNARTTSQTTLGVVGAGVGTRTDYDRFVQMDMFSLPEYRSSQKYVAVYQGKLLSTGSIGDLSRVMPTLMAGLLEDFPGKSGGSRSTTLMLR